MEKPGHDALIERLRARAGDPARRTEEQPSVFMSGLGGLDLSELANRLQGAQSDLMRLLGSIREGQPIDPEIQARADQVQADMTTPAPAEPVAPASADAVTRAEAALGFPLPPLLRRIYQEVGDGGFGPGSGLLSTAAIGSTYQELRSEPPSETDQEWPEGLVPLVDRGDGYDCLDVASGSVMAADYDEVEQDGDVVWGLSVRELSPSLEAWLETWL